MTNLGTAIATTTKTCMKCEAAPAVLTLTNNDRQEWQYCTDCAKASIYGAAPEYDGGPLAYVVRYIYPAKGLLRSDLPADALALCR